MTIPERQNELDAFYREHLADEPRKEVPSGNGHSPRLSDEEVIKRLTHESTDKGARLFEGDTSGYQSHSEADQALCNQLAFYTQDADQLERVWRSSRLWREKGDTHRSYAARTIERAIDQTEETYKESSIKIGSGKATAPEPITPGGFGAHRTMIGGFIEQGIPEPEFLYQDVLVKGMIHHIFAGPEEGKTWVAMSISKSVVDRGGVAIYLDKENGARIFGERMQVLEADTKALDERLYYFTEAPMSLEDEHVDAFLDYIRGLEPDLVIFDSQIGFLSDAGISENDNTDIERWARTFLTPLRDMDVTTVLLDHVPHEGNRARGATRKTDFTDVQWKLKRTEPFGRDSVGEITLSKTKDRVSAVPDKVKFAVGGGAKGFVFKRADGLVTSDGGFILARDGAKKTAEALKGFGSSGATSKEWETTAAGLGVSRSQHFEHRKHLRDRAVYRQEGNRYYWKPKPGELGSPYTVSPVQSGLVHQSSEDRTKPGLEGSDSAETRMDSGDSQSGFHTGLDSENRTKPVVRSFPTPISGENRTGRTVEKGTKPPALSAADYKAQEAVFRVQQGFGPGAHVHPNELDRACGEFGLKDREIREGRKLLEQSERIGYHIAPRYPDSYYYIPAAPEDRTKLLYPVEVAEDSPKVTRWSAEPDIPVGIHFGPAEPIKKETVHNG